MLCKNFSKLRNYILIIMVLPFLMCIAYEKPVVLRFAILAHSCILSKPAYPVSFSWLTLQIHVAMVLCFLQVLGNNLKHILIIILHFVTQKML